MRDFTRRLENRAVDSDSYSNLMPSFAAYSATFHSAGTKQCEPADTVSDRADYRYALHLHVRWHHALANHKPQFEKSICTGKAFFPLSSRSASDFNNAWHTVWHARYGFVVFNQVEKHVVYALRTGCVVYWAVYMGYFPDAAPHSDTDSDAMPYASWHKAYRKAVRGGDVQCAVALCGFKYDVALCGVNGKFLCRRIIHDGLVFGDFTRYGNFCGNRKDSSAKRTTCF